MNATYESDEAATAALVQDSELPHEIPQSSLYYMAVWEKIPLEYGVRHHYQSLDGSYPTEVETKYYGDGRIDETITTDATAGEPFAKAVETLDGFEKPFTRNVTVIKGEPAPWPTSITPARATRRPSTTM